jgi:predicted  nucleic acid-binding Zn-ribbon protein
MTKTSLLRSSVLASSLCLAGVALAGCGEITKVQECGAVIESINSNSGVFKEADNVNDDSKKIDEYVKKLEEFEKKLGEVKVTDAELKKSVGEYREMITKMASLFKDSKDPAKVEGLEKRSKEITDKEDELVKKINGYCNRQ